MEITEKVAYLKGLMEGMKIDTETNEGKILSAMVDILEDIGLELEDLWNAQGELEDGLDVVSDDLEDVRTLCTARMMTRTSPLTMSIMRTMPRRTRTATPPPAPPARRPSTSTSPSWRRRGHLPNCGAKLEFDLSDLANDEDEDQE